MKEKQRKKTSLNKEMSSNFDVNGSYTGTPTFDGDKAPVQDADDL